MQLKTIIAAGAALLFLGVLAKRARKWPTKVVKKAIRRGREKGSARFIKSLPHPPKSLSLKNKFEQFTINRAMGYWINKEKASNGVLVYLHGGGYAFGPVKYQWKYIARLSQQTDKAAILIDYKMAPQAPFPQGLEDVMTIITALQATGELPNDYYLLGDSAGGGLALATCYRLREQQQPLPRKLVLMSPWLDINMSDTAYKQTADKDVMLTYEAIMGAAAKYASNHDPRNPLISPLFGDVEGLPPTLIQIGTAEIFLSDNRTFQQRLLKARVPLQYEEYEDMFHVFQLLYFLPESRKAIKSQIRFLTSD
ncbi:alpha/beta hydrolase [Sabulibacter ruber]|uniref:alpha/beta hydrolase n=1 Tax=Sabulibacter ruber TaxID=2811901 RepID=UPI001A963457|nr:alpha/beta hydrolase [Sabulibacter ruber]